MLTMSGFLADLLGVSALQLTPVLNELEAASGHPNADVRLITDISSKIHRKHRELGLDPLDTNGHELYQALQDLIRRHDEFVVTAMGGHDVADVRDILSRLPQTIVRLRANKRVWALKHSVAKRLLKDHPPRSVMKQLGYRSVDSLLKRERLSEIFAALYFSESAAWQRSLIKSYKRLRPSDFESRRLEVIRLSDRRWDKAATAFVRRQGHSIIAVKELGVIAILPTPVKRLPGIGLTALAHVLHSINQLRFGSARFKFQQVRPDFGRVFVTTLLDEPPLIDRLVNQPIHWRVIQRLYGTRRTLPEVFGPHMQPDDLGWDEPGDILYKLEPALQFWQELNYIGARHDDGPVSLNLLDAATSYCNQLPYGQQTTHHFRQNLWDELVSRYLAQPALEQQILQALDQPVTAVTPRPGQLVSVGGGL